MPWINGLGGAFVFSNEPKRLADWYADIFDLAFEGGDTFFYHVFWSLDSDHPDRRRDTTFSIIQATTPLPHRAPEEEPESMYGDQPFMVNLRTDDLDALLDRLDARGVPIIQQQNEPYGKFAWIRDPDGHRVELYQPLASTA